MNQLQTKPQWAHPWGMDGWMNGNKIFHWVPVPWLTQFLYLLPRLLTTH
jgi:hypothetical protein